MSSRCFGYLHVYRIFTESRRFIGLQSETLHLPQSIVLVSAQEFDSIYMYHKNYDWHQFNIMLFVEKGLLIAPQLSQVGVSTPVVGYHLRHVLV